MSDHPFVFYLNDSSVYWKYWYFLKKLIFNLLYFKIDCEFIIKCWHEWLQEYVNLNFNKLLTQKISKD